MKNQFYSCIGEKLKSKWEGKNIIIKKLSSKKRQNIQLPLNSIRRKNSVSPFLFLPQTLKNQTPKIHQNIIVTLKTFCLQSTIGGKGIIEIKKLQLSKFLKLSKKILWQMGSHASYSKDFIRTKKKKKKFIP